MPEENSTRSRLVAPFDHSDIPAPSCTPVRGYRFSDRIHRDRHLFLKHASFDVGFYGGDLDLMNWQDRSEHLQGDAVHEGQYDGEQTTPPAGQFLNVGMALGSGHLPLLHHVHMALSSADLQHQQRRRPQLQDQHQHQLQQMKHRFSRGGRQRLRRPLNETLNTYVDTQKRIRSVQCLDDLYRRSPPPVLPYLSTATPRRRAATNHAATAGDAGRGDAAMLRLTPTAATPRDDASRDSPSSRSCHHPPGLPVVNMPRLQEDGEMGEKSARDEDPEEALLRARQALRSTRRGFGKKSSSYATPEFVQPPATDRGHAVHMFACYPRRVLVHPGKLRKQRTEAFLTSKTKLRL